MSRKYYQQQPHIAALAAPGQGGAMVPAQQQRAYDLTVSTLPPIYGCSGLFDACGDNDIMSLSFQGQDPFLDWIGWTPTNVCRIKKNFISWVAPSGTAADTPTSSVLADPCADAPSVEWGKCDFTFEDFSRLRRAGPVRDQTKKDLVLCSDQPRFRLDGNVIADDDEYDMRLALEVLMQDFKRLVVTGNKATPGEFDGLARLFRTGYLNSNGQPCTPMNSFVVDWNGAPMAGASAGGVLLGKTLNGAALDDTWSFLNVLSAIFNRIRARIRWSPELNSQRLQVGDVVLVLPSEYVNCILNMYTCWSVCPGGQYNEVNMNTYEARQFRQNLNGGMFGAGRIFLDGFEIPIMPYDWGLIGTGSLFDAYLLTGAVGNVPLIEGQYNDMRGAAARDPEVYTATDGGRVLTWSKFDNTCVQRVVEMQPRILSWAPWTSARFIDLTCSTVLPPMSPDPLSPNFYEQTLDVVP